MEPFLETERLLLRAFIPADLHNLFELDGDPEVMRYITGGEPTPLDVLRDEILPRFLQYDERLPGRGFWAAIERSTGDFVGWFGLRQTEVPNEVTLGYRLRRAAWGRGYATEGARALVAKGFTELGVERVVATTYGENVASRRVMEKAGLRFVRAFRVTPEDLAAAGTFQAVSEDLWDGDDVEYALDKADWIGQTPPDERKPGTLVVVYGPPAAGKLTVATALAELTGYKVFHNHLTVNAVRELFEFRSPEYVRALQRIRVDLLEHAVAVGINVIFTWVYTRDRTASRPTVADEFARAVERVVAGAGGVVRYVRLCPPPAVLEARVSDGSRTRQSKLDTVKGLRREMSVREYYDVLHPDDLHIDNSALRPQDVARMIADHYALG